MEPYERGGAYKWKLFTSDMDYGSKSEFLEAEDAAKPQEEVGTKGEVGNGEDQTLNFPSSVQKKMRKYWAAINIVKTLNPALPMERFYSRLKTGRQYILS